MVVSKKHTKPKSLSHGRPPTTKRAPALSSRATRTLIRSHHTLQKQKAIALKAGDAAKAAELEATIQKQGGIEKYQVASLLGQGKERGGDSSRVLMEWLRPAMPLLKERKDGERLRLLEVGALSTSNACSKSGVFEIERIDLNSQSEGITQQDFMERPLAKLATEKFDIISLSLVLNYVPDPAARGEMLRRTLQFLRGPLGDNEEELRAVFPALFLVLPAPCVTNSRYMDEPKLEAIMMSLGYVKVQYKLSNKLVYYLWRAVDLVPKARKEMFKKVEVRAGGSRNNFAVVLK
jgi:25S rRNA (adenine2142-N1)-methyltransferase